MEIEEIKQIAQQVYDQNSNKSQYNVDNVSLHVHNGLDSNSVSFTNLINKFIIFPYTLFGTQGATAGNYSTFFTAPVAMTVSQITEVHAVKGTDGSAVTLQIEKLTGTTAPGSGTNLLSTDFNLKGTINTVVTGVLSPFVGVIQLNAGDRLALKLTGTPTAVANVTVTLIINF